MITQTKLQILELTYFVFEGKESNGDKHTELASTFDLENPDQRSVKEVFWEHTDDCVPEIITFFIDLHNFFNIYFFEVKESIAGISSN